MSVDIQKIIKGIEAKRNKNSSNDKINFNFQSPEPLKNSSSQVGNTPYNIKNPYGKFARQATPTTKTETPTLATPTKNSIVKSTGISTKPKESTGLKVLNTLDKTVGQVPEAILSIPGYVLGAAGSLIGGTEGAALETGRQAIFDHKLDPKKIWKETVNTAKSSAKGGFDIGRGSAGLVTTAPFIPFIILYQGGKDIMRGAEKTGSFYEQAKQEKVNFPKTRAALAGIEEMGKSGYEMAGADKELAKILSKNSLGAGIGTGLWFSFMVGSAISIGEMTNSAVQKLPQYKVTLQEQPISSEQLIKQVKDITDKPGNISEPITTTNVIDGVPMVIQTQVKNVNGKNYAFMVARNVEGTPGQSYYAIWVSEITLSGKLTRPIGSKYPVGLIAKELTPEQSANYAANNQKAFGSIPTTPENITPTNIIPSDGTIVNAPGKQQGQITPPVVPGILPKSPGTPVLAPGVNRTQQTTGAGAQKSEFIIPDKSSIIQKAILEKKIEKLNKERATLNTQMEQAGADMNSALGDALKKNAFQMRDLTTKLQNTIDNATVTPGPTAVERPTAPSSAPDVVTPELTPTNTETTPTTATTPTTNATVQNLVTPKGTSVNVGNLEPLGSSPKILETKLNNVYNTKKPISALMKIIESQGIKVPARLSGIKETGAFIKRNFNSSGYDYVAVTNNRGTNYYNTKTGDAYLAKPDAKKISKAYRKAYSKPVSKETADMGYPKTRAEAAGVEKPGSGGYGRQINPTKEPAKRGRPPKKKAPEPVKKAEPKKTTIKDSQAPKINNAAPYAEQVKRKQPTKATVETRGRAPKINTGGVTKESKAVYTRLMEEHKKKQIEKKRRLREDLEREFYAKFNEEYESRNKGIGGMANRPIRKNNPYKNKTIQIQDVMYRIVKKHGAKMAEKGAPRGAAGAINIKSGFISVKSLIDVPTVTHELAHKYDLSTKTTEKIIKSNDLASLNELNAVFDVYYPMADKLRKKLSTKDIFQEGYAMFIQRMAENPNATKKEYSTLYNNIIKKDGSYYNKNVNELLDDVDHVIAKYKNSGELEQASQELAGEMKGVDPGHYLGVLDRLQAFSMDNKQALKVLSQDLGLQWSERNPYTTLNSLNHVANMSRTNVLTPGKGYWSYGDNFKMKKMGDIKENFADLIKKLYDKDLVREYDGYLKRRLEYFTELRKRDYQKEQTQIMALLESGKFGLGEEKILRDGYNKLSEKIASIKKIQTKDKTDLAKAESVYKNNKDKFIEEDRIYDALGKDSLRVKRLVEMLDEESYQDLKQRKGYANAKRFFLDDILAEDDGGTSSGVFSNIKNTFVSKPSTLLKRIGSYKALRSPLFSAIVDHTETMAKAQKIISYRTLLEAVKENQDMFNGIIRIKDKPEIIPKGNGVEFVGKNKDNAVVIKYKGKYYQMDMARSIKQVYDLAFAVDDFGLLFKKMKFLSSAMVKATTGPLNMGFSPVNLLIDSPVTFTQSKTNFIPILSGFKNMIYDIHFNPETKKHWEEFMVGNGKGMSEARTFENKGYDLLKIYEKESLQPEGARKIIKKLVDYWQLPFDLIEISNRFPEYNNLRHFGVDIDNAMQRAKDTSVDFSRIGSFGGTGGMSSVAKGAVSVTPYSRVNPSIISTFLDSIRWSERPYTKKGPNTGNRLLSNRAKIVFAALALSTIEAYYLYNKSKGLEKAIDEGDTKAIEGYTSSINDFEDRNSYKNTNFLDIYTDKNRGTFQTRVSSVLLGPSTVIEMLMAQYYFDVKYSAKDWIDVSSQYIPNTINILNPGDFTRTYITQPGKLALTLFLKKKTFPNFDDIEKPFWELSHTPSEGRYFPHTNKTAVALGQTWLAKKLNLSPLVIERALKDLGSSYDAYTQYGNGIRKENSSFPNIFEITGEATKEQFLKNVGYENSYLFVGKRFDDFYNKKGEIEYKYRTTLGKIDLHEENAIIQKTSTLMSVARRADYLEPIPKNIKNSIYNIVDLINKNKYDEAVNAYIDTVTKKDVSDMLINDAILKRDKKIKDVDAAFKELKKRANTNSSSSK